MTCESCGREWKKIITPAGEYVVGIKEGIVVAASQDIKYLMGTQEQGLADVCHSNGWELK